LKKLFTSLLAGSVGLTSCAYVTHSEQTAADRYLNGNCKEIFLSSRTSASPTGYGYQYYRYQKRAFAVANFNGQQYCGFASGGTQDSLTGIFAAGQIFLSGRTNAGQMGSLSRSEIQELALKYCQSQLPSNLRCEIFAEDDTILNPPPTYRR
jgi:hypothetical protein